MRISKYTFWKILLSVLCAALVACSLLGFAVSGRSTDAITGSTASVSAIYDFENHCYDEESLDALARRLFGNASDFEDMLARANDAGTAGAPLSNKEATVEYGRFRSSANSQYRPLVWLPVYISKASSGDAVLTLYLASSASATSSVSSQENAYFSYNHTYSTSPNVETPTNSYGTSHIRSVVLGNLGQYVQYTTDHNGVSRVYQASTIGAQEQKYSDFTQIKGAPGELFDDIVTPSDMLWQANESAITSIDSGSAYSRYSWPNEAYGAPSSKNYYLPNYFDYSSDVGGGGSNKTDYEIWQNDKVWLPSLSEVGTGDIDGNGAGIRDGIWQLTNYQRSNNTAAWLRTAFTNDPKTGPSGGQYSTYTMFGTAANGTITTLDVSSTTRYGVRPAIHLNLSKIAGKTSAPIVLPDEGIFTTYNGEHQDISIDNVTVDSSQLAGWWRNDGTMNVHFYEDNNGVVDMDRGISPRDAGKYWMDVELLNRELNFYGEPTSTRHKTIPFTVEKIKLTVNWTYDETENNTPTSVSYDPTQLLARDVDAGNVPEIAMRYSNILGVGIRDSIDFPDEKGTYTATAFIVDEDTFNYNYTVDESTRVSEEFTVKERNLELPYFLEVGAGVTTMELSYKGRQYVQIANVLEEYIEISVEVIGTDDAITEIAKQRMRSLGVVNGVQTFILETVAEYRFTAHIKDEMNTQWSSSTADFKDVADKTIILTVSRAQITVNFDGVPSSWDTSTEMPFTLTILGVYDDSEINMRVYYSTPTGSNINIQRDPATGRYVIPRISNPGDNYSLVAVMNQQSSSNYYMTAAKTQKFSIVRAVAEFGSARANWIYTVGNSTSINPAGGYDAHNTPENALVVDNVDNFYKFSLSWTEDRITELNLRATYTGDTYVKDAGLYSVTVVISGYDKNVEFRDETYTIYFRIRKKLFDLSNLRWSYEDTPYVYSGEQHTVMLVADTLPEGLTATYMNSGDGIDAGHYTTVVRFIVSDENYEVPSDSVENSYLGPDFAFTCEWEIVAQEIVVSWNTGDTANDVMFIPTLRVGHGYVNYTFEHYEDGSWVAADTVHAETVTERYRVTAVLKPEFANNFILIENLPQEFNVESGKQPVVLGFTVNDRDAENDSEFAYSGTSFIVRPKSLTTGVEISDYSVEYFSVTSSGVKGTSLGNNAPTNVGRYAAAAAVTFEGGYLAEGSSAELYFEIVKADMDVSGLRWAYSYEIMIGTTIATVTVRVHWDDSQKKWIDDEGREANISFEYDGSEKSLRLEGEETVPELYVTGTNGNTGTTANTYSASLVYTMSDNYNHIDLPALSWEIRKATINLQNVKWGYVDDNGEHEFDFDNGAFTYTRDENGEVPFTVALINLPSYISSYFSYRTINRTKVNSREEEGNSFSSIGSYSTRFIFTGEFSDANHNMFNASSIPASISTFVQWEIAARELTRPIYNESWSEYDDRTHDLMAMCNMPTNELYYFNIDITFIDSDYNLTNHYDGSNYYDNGNTYNYGGKYIAKNAGTYIIDFNQIMDIDGENTNIFWSRVQIEVRTTELEVTWDNQGSYPVARVTGVAVSEIIGTRYLSASGREVPIANILRTNGLTFFAEPYVTAEFKKNIRIRMADGQEEQLEFTSYYFEVNGSTISLQYPIMEVEELEYTGEQLTFSILNWFQDYERYLYISDGGDFNSDRGEIYATAIGEYHILVSFKRDANAYWSGTDGNRSSYPLTFRITRPSRMAIEFPVLNAYSVDYTGEGIEFVITNWMLLREYLDYEVFYTNVSQGTNLIQTAAGIYTIRFSFKPESIGYWQLDPDNPKREYVLQFEIVDPNADVRELRNPTFTTSVTNVQATGVNIYFTIADWSNYSNYVDIISNNESVVISSGDGRVGAVEVGSYLVTVKIKDGLNVVFADGGKESILSFTIMPNPNLVSHLDKPVFVQDTMGYTGGALQFKIANWDTIYKDLVEIVGGAGVQIESDGSIIVTDIGDYTVEIRFKAGVNADWKEGGNDSVTLPFRVTSEQTETVNLNVPELTFNEREFTGGEIEFVIANWDAIKDYVEIIGSFKQTETGTYTVTVRLKAGAQWQNVNGGVSTADRTLTFTIKQATMEVDVGDDGTVTIKNGDGEQMHLDDYLNFVYTYTDENGNEVEVPADELEDGKEYTLKISVKDDKLADFNKNVANSAQIRQDFANTDYKITYNKGGIDLKLILIIVGAVVAALVVIVIIIVVVKKRNSGDYYYDDEGYDDGYDEYGDEYDDYDDYDDEYDDEYYEDEY